ncbi:MAG: hypothetical protein IT289_13480 [Oligoflexia bacterium]|nr:hypothetical protein [Oligoflexia bacterium]
MNIKLGRNHRLKLSAEECELLRKSEQLRETFELSPNLRFVIVIQKTESQSDSTLSFEGQAVFISISEKDFNLLTSEVSAKDGFRLGNYVLQRDLWSAKIRDKRTPMHVS